MMKRNKKSENNIDNWRDKNHADFLMSNTYSCLINYPQYAT